MSQQNNPMVQIAMKVQEILHETPDIEYSKAFYDCKNHFGGMAGVAKDDFKEIFDKTKEEFNKPLSQAGYKLAIQEQETKQSLVDALYQMETTGPDHVRELMGLAKHLRGTNEHQMLGAVKDCLTLVDESLADECRACWPGDLEESDE